MKKNTYNTDIKEIRNKSNLEYIYNSVIDIERNQDFNLWIDDISKNGLVIHGSLI